MQSSINDLQTSTRLGQLPLTILDMLVTIMPLLGTTDHLSVVMVLRDAPLWSMATIITPYLPFIMP